MRMSWLWDIRCILLEHRKSVWIRLLFLEKVYKCEITFFSFLKVSQLKIDNNPYARAFRAGGGRTFRKRKSLEKNSQMPPSSSSSHAHNRPGIDVAHYPTPGKFSKFNFNGSTFRLGNESSASNVFPVNNVADCISFSRNDNQSGICDERSVLQYLGEDVAHHHQEKTLLASFQSGQFACHGSSDFPDVSASFLAPGVAASSCQYRLWDCCMTIVLFYF